MKQRYKDFAYLRHICLNFINNNKITLYKKTETEHTLTQSNGNTTGIKNNIKPFIPI